MHSITLSQTTDYYLQDLKSAVEAAIDKKIGKERSDIHVSIMRHAIAAAEYLGLQAPPAAHLNKGIGKLTKDIRTKVHTLQKSYGGEKNKAKTIIEIIDTIRKLTNQINAINQKSKEIENNPLPEELKEFVGKNIKEISAIIAKWDRERTHSRLNPALTSAMQALISWRQATIHVLATEIGVSPATVDTWRQGKNVPTLQAKTLHKLATWIYQQLNC